MAATASRFIDFAHHGGCSQKLAPERLRGLLPPAAPGDAVWPDAGIKVVGGQTFASSIDVVLPMIDDSALFGRIVANHVLSDLYATAVVPVFAVNILGVPDGLFGADGRSEEEIDSEIREMLNAAEQTMSDVGATLLGGHTLAFDVLFFGMAATGVAANGRTIASNAARPGDSLILTKPIGTSVATKAWKVSAAGPQDFGDVLAGMLRSNQVASEAMLDLERCSCTDVTGFGLFGHLHNMLEGSGVSAVVHASAVPVYPSARAEVGEESATRIFAANLEFTSQYVRNLDFLSGSEQLLMIDAQVSGGLLVAAAPSEAGAYLAALRKQGEEGWIVGEITAGNPGEIVLA
jgi:selenium donor protein